MNWIRETFLKDRTGRSGLINLAMKPISLVISLVCTPLLLDYLGDEKYGLWATLLSIINWINYFDVGIGNGLRNILTKEISEQKRAEAQKSVSTAYVLLSSVSVILLLASLIGVLIVDWHSLLSTSVNMQVPMAISFGFITVNFVLSLVNTILYSLQKSEIIAISNCVTQLLNLVGLLLLKRIIHSSIVAMSLIFGLSSLTVHVCVSFLVFRKNPYLRPSFSSISKEKTQTICGVGIKYFVIQIMGILLFTVDNILITHFFGAPSVTPFSIVNRVYNTAYSVFAAFMVPFWSRATVAFHETDSLWLKNAIKKSCFILAVFICGYVLLTFLFKPIAYFWLQKKLEYPTGLIPVMCVFYALFSVLCVECQFINGSGRINTQLISYVVIGVANIPLSICLGVNCGMGSVGIRLATAILVFIEVVVLGLDLRYILASVENNRGA